MQSLFQCMFLQLGRQVQQIGPQTSWQVELGRPVSKPLGRQNQVDQHKVYILHTTCYQVGKPTPAQPGRYASNQVGTLLLKAFSRTHAHILLNHVWVPYLYRNLVKTFHLSKENKRFSHPLPPIPRLKNFQVLRPIWDHYGLPDASHRAESDLVGQQPTVFGQLPSAAVNWSWLASPKVVLANRRDKVCFTNLGDPRSKPSVCELGLG